MGMKNALVLMLTSRLAMVSLVHKRFVLQRTDIL